MKQRELRDFLEDILEAINLIENITDGLDFVDFFEHKEIFWAVVKLVEIIGEAVKNIPGKIREDYPQIPWRNIAGMRDKLVHEYWAIDEQMIWQVIVKELPDLKSTIMNLVENLSERLSNIGDRPK
jgi:uncharacterized protein with HEPN domain